MHMCHFGTNVNDASTHSPRTCASLRLSESTDTTQAGRVNEQAKFGILSPQHRVKGQGSGGQVPNKEKRSRNRARTPSLNSPGRIRISSVLFGMLSYLLVVVNRGYEHRHSDNGKDNK